MTDDIVTRLQNECQCSDDCRAVNDPCIPMRAADEIELLRVALQMACYEIFAYRDPRQTSPQKLVDHFMSEAVRGD